MATILSHHTSIQLLRSPGFDFNALLSKEIDNSVFWLDVPPLKIKSTALYALPEDIKPSAKDTCHAWSQTYQLALPISVITNKEQRRNNDLCICHCITALPKGKHFFRINETLYACTPELSFALLAGNLSLMQLICLGYEICGFYTIRGETNTAFKSFPLTTTARLQEFCDNSPDLRGTRKARVALKYVQDNSASPAETACSMLLSLPRKYGGYGLPQPAINHTVPRHASIIDETGQHEQRIVTKCDLTWDNLILEYDSAQEHSTYEKIEQDAIRRNELSPSATVLQVTKSQLASREQTDHLAHLVARHLNHRIRTSVNDQYQRECFLRQEINTAHRNKWLKL